MKILQIEAKIKNMLKHVRLIVTDFDGVWTNGKVIFGQDGTEYVVCSRKDTLRIKEIQALGIKIIVISKEKNNIVSKRCKKMQVQCFHGQDDKVSLLEKILLREKVKPTEVIYVGDDLNDIGCLNFVGLPITVADGDPKCKEVARYITSRKGGDHAMREIFDLILETRKLL